MIRYLFSSLLLMSMSLWAVTNSVIIYDTSSTTQTDRPITVARWFEKGEIANYAQPVVGGTPETTWQCDVRNRWADSSLKFALISFKHTIAASGSITVTFQNNTDPCSSGNQAACDAAGLDEAGILAFKSSTWGAEIAVESPDGDDTARSAKARDMVDAADFSYLLRGPVVTQVLVEDATTARSYDFGWTCSTNCTNDYSTATWVDDTTNRSLHPVFVLTMYTGWSGVEIQYILENLWSTLLQDQRYKVTLKSDSTSSTTEMAQTTATQYARTRWRKVYWDGDEPGSIRTDHNMEYLVEAKALVNYDTTLTPTSTTISDEETAMTSNLAGLPFACTSASYCGRYLLGMGTAGGRGELGVLERWNVLYLLSMDPGSYSTDLYDDMITHAEISSTVPIHYRESTTGLYFDDGDSVDAFGKVFSVDAQPNGRIHPTYWSSTYPPLATLSGSYGWGPELNHHPPFAWLAYLLTGDWFFQQEVLYWGAISFGAGAPGKNVNWVRGDTWARVGGNMRGEAWCLRSGNFAAIFATDGTPEATYFRQKVEYNLAVFEGRYDISSGTYYTTCSTSPYNPDLETSPYCWGRNTVEFITPAHPLHRLEGGSLYDDGNWDATITHIRSPWQENYFRVTLLEISEQNDGNISSGAQEILEWSGKNLVEGILHPDISSPLSPFDLGIYHYAAKQGITNPTLTSGIGSTDLTVPVSSVPSEYDTFPMSVKIDAEYLRICSTSTNQLNVCSSGRGFNATAKASHSSGASVVFYPPVPSWSFARSHYDGVENTDFPNNGSCLHGYSYIALAALAGVQPYTYGSYSGASAWDWWVDQSPSPSRSTLDLTCQAEHPTWALLPRAYTPPPPGSGSRRMAGAVSVVGQASIK